MARWTSRIGLGEQIVTTMTLGRRIFALARRLTRPALRITLHLPQRYPLETPIIHSFAGFRAILFPT